MKGMLFQIPQRYRFSSKSQLCPNPLPYCLSCFRYHKGTDFQANHNYIGSTSDVNKVVLDTTKVQIFKQITTRHTFVTQRLSCFRYHKGTDFQANHNRPIVCYFFHQLFQIPQRYRFSSKSQRRQDKRTSHYGCFRYHKGTDFQANHNILRATE